MVDTSSNNPPRYWCSTCGRGQHKPAKRRKSCQYFDCPSIEGYPTYEYTYAPKGWQLQNGKMVAVETQQQTPPVPTESDPSTIEEINSASDHTLRFRHFKRLKAGRDQYSRLTLAALTAAVPATTLSDVEAEIANPKYQAIALRWCLRGLSPQRAIRKALTDAEIAGQAVFAWEKGA